MSEAEERPAAAPDGAPVKPPRKRKGSRALLTLLALLLVSLAGFWAGVSYLLSPADAGAAEEEFEIMPGWGGARVAVELADAQLIRSEPLFRYYLRFKGLDTQVGEGLYDLSAAMSVPEIADALVAGGRPRTLLIVIPEGWRAVDVVTRLAANGLGDAETLSELVTSPGDLAPPYLPEGQPLEGYFFPATYEVPVRSSEEEVLKLLLDRFEEELTDEVLTEVKEAGLTVDEWVNLASIVQAEAASHEEMPIIAGVFLNRLESEMLLQADPTVAYGLGKRLPELSAVAGDLQEDTPWNTYTRAGLPITPISNPGQDALHAVLAPVRESDAGEPWLYFLHGTDGGVPVFRPNTSLGAHERDVVVYLRNDGRH